MFGSKRNKLPLDAPEAPDDSAETDSTPAKKPVGGRVLYSARQPILDRSNTVFGYELLFRSGPENRYSATDPDWASATSLEQSASVFGLDHLVGDRRAFVNLSRGALLAEYHLLLPRERIVVELLESVEPDDEVLAACQRLKASGYLLALDDYAGESRSEPFLGLVDFVKVDLRQWDRALDPRAVSSLKRPGLQLLAEKVETHTEQQAALAAGYDLMQGYYFCKPQMVEVRDLPPSKLSVLRFLAETSSSDTSIARLAELFRADVGLTVRLLRYLNSVAFGWRHEITSIQHALELMGERPLRRWATMLALMSLCDDRPHELLVTALSRARFAERISAPSGMPEHEQSLFLAGMLSLVDAMVGRPVLDILDGLAIPDLVRTAVLDRGTPLGQVLDMVSAYQRGDWQQVEDSRGDSRVTDRQLDEAYVDSLAWAEAVAV